MEQYIPCSMSHVRSFFNVVRNYETVTPNVLKAVDTGVSLRKAAAVYGVPIATLFRKKGNPEISKQKTGPATVSSGTEEQKIVDWILFRAQRGLPVTKTELLDSI
ncbi:Protein of unknown function [Cotesia congregata]|uniref:HTH psq-type domain-containing protein n=1 Tax=Cotesia congregata TaxID=51543 RepID=A0A8J2MKT3_COTCN|nr:Protein of unknown function [Cotesia congregata]